jgi:hypothetical protein
MGNVGAHPSRAHGAAYPCLKTHAGDRVVLRK